MVTRKNVRNLSTAEINKVRKAFELMYALDGNNLQDFRSYCTWAGYHGIPGSYCPHGTDLFLTWHRAYMYGMEQTMQQLLNDETFALPYWDWTSQESQQNGIPQAYTVQQYTDDDGNVKPNPLFRARMCFDNQFTTRSPGNSSELGNLAQLVTQAQQASNSYQDITAGLENPHNGLHVWVGNSMSSINTAAYDPIFYAHHCNVDRQWWQWQQTHPGVNPTNTAVPLAPFNMTVADVLNAAQLDYTYAAAVSAIDIKTKKCSTGLRALNKHLGTFDLGRLERKVSKAKVQVTGITPPEKSYILHVYVNSPKASEKTKTRGNPKYAGAIYFFGHGKCTGGKGHCEETPTYGRQLARPDHMVRYDREIDITHCLDPMYKNKAGLHLSFVAVDYKGKRLNLDKELDATGVGVKYED